MPMPRNSSHRQACLPLATVCGLHFLLGAVWEDPTQAQWLPGQLPPPHLQHMGDGARLKFVSALCRKPLWCCFFFGDVRSYSADCEFCMFCQIETRIRQPEHGSSPGGHANASTLHSAHCPRPRRATVSIVPAFALLAYGRKSHAVRP